ncbi:MAG TPA: hypothetical protein VFP98_08675, partial [Candidatus Polarisedimenticolia bacterium]|nr:hypothetical protein [Candidatus Polarisedimenticolia bacterium]
ARELNESLDPQFAELSLVRWHGPRLYLASAARGLWRYDTLDGSLKLLLGPSDERGSRHQFDICEDERQVVYTRQRASRPDLWLADLSTGETRPLTSRQPGPDDFESKARWLGSGCRELVFGSNRSGQLDLWQLSLPGEERRQITFSAGSKHVEDTSRDGSLISMREDLRSAHLWMMEVRPDAPGPRQLTADSRDDFWPSASADGTIVFHRTPPRIDNASGMLDAQIFRGRLQAGRIVDAKLVVLAGTGARISPDGRWLAFTREADAKGYEVWIEDRASERSWRIAGMYRPPRLYPHPIDQVETNLAWSADSGSLFFVVRGPEGGDRLKRFRPDSGKGSVEDLVASKPGEILHDPLPAADARIVCYVLSTTGSSLASRVICHDLTSGARSPPWSPPGPPGADLLLRGWVRPQGEALVLQCDVMGDWTERIELWALRTDASARRIGRIDRAFGGTSRWEEGSSTLYLTKAEEHASAHNLYAYRPEDGSLTRLTNFDTPGISIDGLEILGGGRLVFALAERNENIWLIRLRRQGG